MRFRLFGWGYNSDRRWRFRLVEEAKGHDVGPRPVSVAYAFGQYEIAGIIKIFVLGVVERQHA